VSGDTFGLDRELESRATMKAAGLDSNGNPLSDLIKGSSGGRSQPAQIPILSNLPTREVHSGEYAICPFDLGGSETDIKFEGGWKFFGYIYYSWHQIGPVTAYSLESHQRNCSENKIAVYEADDEYWRLVWEEGHHVAHGEGSGFFFIWKKMEKMERNSSKF